jgi:hypothetical protein
VQYNDEVAAFELYRDVYISMPLLEYDEFEIIGNIYEKREGGADSFCDRDGWR